MESGKWKENRAAPELSSVITRFVIIPPMRTPKEKQTNEEFNAEIAQWIRATAICRACGG
jgi:hypothetical protein